MESWTSLWADQVAADVVRAPLSGSQAVDVAIVGAGYTGLWTALALLRADPALRVLVIERETVGFGASGRNGGWCVGELAGGLHGAIRTHGRDAGIRLTRSIMETVDEIGRTLAEEQIDADFTKGGVIRLARTTAQLDRQREEAELFESCGFSDEVSLLDPTAATERLAAPDTLGGLHYRPCARVHPSKLVHGLATAVERRGGTIVEHTAVTEIRPGGGIRPGGAKPTVVTDRGVVTADVIVRATEGYTRDLPGLGRSLVPLYSLMVATEPLPAELWDEIGLRDRETFCDDRRMVIYGQRTADERIAFGGRSAGYGFGSRIDPSMERGVATHDRIVATLRQLLPMLGDAAITHWWGGVLGVPRDWRPSVGFDGATGLAWAGGYVGEGVAAANLAGRTLADLITGAATDLTSLPWVGHRSRRWEPEPLRWVGINGSVRLAALADRTEARSASGRPSRLGAVIDRLTH